MLKNRMFWASVSMGLLLASGMGGCPGLFESLFGTNTDNTNNTDSNNVDINNNDTTDANSTVNDNNNNDNLGLDFVLTKIRTHVQGHMAVGDDLIAFAAVTDSGGPDGVAFIIPSEGDTTAREIPGGADFAENSFAVSKNGKIWLINNFVVTIYDTVKDTSTVLDTNDIRPVNIPVDPEAAGHTQSSGNYFVTRNDAGIVTDGAIVKVIDVSSDTPDIISFPKNPGGVTSGFQVPMVGIDATTMQVVAVANDIFYVYDMTDPNADPAEFDVSALGGIDTDTQFKFDGMHILYHDDSTKPVAMLLDISTAGNKPVELDNNPASGAIELVDGRFAFFTQESLGSDYQSAIGTASAAPSSTIAADDNPIDGSTTNNGYFGWGQTLAIELNAAVWWMAGDDNVGSGSYLQRSTGGAFSTIADPEGADDYGLPASDVNVSENTLSFKYGVDTETYVGYAILN
ncbi:MAG: hypothetical protein KDA32_04795 [Phycisphaerales bacterium]|nr:hypothetical protein [Phycisphaerales bacterium]